ncbi:hypothetical protein GH714_007531 [Hevea brasiliensis]|uniref:Zinc finger GRF-type domain-containing protein n=1 Tax=Hevea brasiliensis TaxID=3981 RepID=A0A6A6LZZ9_HEVBR|nr:hypothetical protein GH714_007531 [Hevea brasiliensis]
MAANSGTWSSGATRSTGTIARVYCLVHNEVVALLTSFTHKNVGRRFFCCPLRKANNRDFFICYDDELVPGSRERCVFYVIFVKMERLQAVISSKEQNEEQYIVKVAKIHVEIDFAGMKAPTVFEIQ